MDSQEDSVVKRGITTFQVFADFFALKKKELCWLCLIIDTQEKLK